MNFTFFRRSQKENAEFTGRLIFQRAENGGQIANFPKIPLLVKLPVNEGFLAVIFVRNRFELAFINTTEIVLQLYLFPLLIEVACFVIKSAIIIFVFLLHKSTKVCLHL